MKSIIRALPTIPTILAIETSSELASAALLYGDHVITRESSGVQTHSQTILPMIQSLLEEVGIGLAQCDAIAFGSGPGSFTGVRTACGIAQGLAFGTNLPLIPVITLAAMAQACLSTQEQQTIDAIDAIDVFTILDARMNEVYWAQYRYIKNNNKTNEEWQIIVEPTLSTATGLVSFISSISLNNLDNSDSPTSNKIIACGNGLIAYASVLDESKFSELNKLNKLKTQVQKNIMPHAKEVGLLARQAFLRGEIMVAHEAQPFYLRNKIALTTAERERKWQTAT